MKKYGMIKRILSLILAIVIAVSAFGVSAFGLDPIVDGPEMAPIEEPPITETPPIAQPSAGQQANQSTNRPVAISQAEVNTIAAGSSVSFAIRQDGSLWAWGHNGTGSLGDGTTIDRHRPVRIPLDNVVSVSVGGTLGWLGGVALQEGGSLWGWGGVPGIGISVLHGGERQLSPVRIMDGVAAVAYEVNAHHVMVIRNDGSLWGWGNNTEGQLGISNSISGASISDPVRVMDNVAAVSVGRWHTTALRTDGSLWAWGNNERGQLATGTTFRNRYTPMKIMDNVVSFSTYQYHTMAVQADGSLWGWGTNFHGILGDGTTTNRYTPVRIMDNVVSASVGLSHTAAIRTDGSLWVWGRNYFGFLGDGTIGDDRLRPVRIMENVSAVTIGHNHTLAIQTDGSLWAWGSNRAGQVGDGTTTDRHSPVRIMDNVTLPGATAGATVPETGGNAGEVVADGGAGVERPPTNLTGIASASGWAQGDITRAVDLGLVPQSLQNNYRANITRAEFAALAVTLYENVTSAEIEARFQFNDTTDVNIEKAAGRGFILGVRSQGMNGFDANPDNEITRQEASAMLMRIMWEITGEPRSVGTHVFADNAQIADWARNSVGIVHTAGIMGGTGNNQFNPTGSFTREQSIITMLRIFDMIN